MKIKRNVIIVISATVILALAALGAWLFSDHSEIKDGIYKIQNNTTYPDAYIAVKDGKAQFFNIDLNALYKDSIVEDYFRYMEGYKKQKLSDSDKEQIKQSIDLNKQFCDSEFVLDYSEENYNLFDTETGIGLYNFGMITDISYLSYEYDWKKRTITLNRQETELIVFKR